MKVLFLTRFDFTYGKKDGGLAISYRNFSLIESYFGTENVKLCIITKYSHKDQNNNIQYFYIKDNIISNYLTYVQLKDRIPIKVEKQISDFINNYSPDLIFWDGSTFGQVLDKLQAKTRSVIYFHNIERQYTWEQVKKHSWLCILRYFATIFNEKKMVKFTKNYVCMNNRDAKLLSDLYRVHANYILPATFSDTYQEVSCITDDKYKKFQLLFIGSYFAHNYKGLIWFIDNVLPELDCKLIIVGKNMERLKKQVSNPKVEIIGTVESLDEYYREADAMVMPIFMGGGMKVKTAEALMYGKTIFASTEALQGYDVDYVNNIYRCDSKSEFINSINEYISSNKKLKMNREIRKLFLDKYCTSAHYFKFKEYLEREVISDN